MKKWESHLVVGLSALIIGAILFSCEISIQFPTVYNTFVEIPYQLNPQNESTFREMLLLLLFGSFLVGIGLGTNDWQPYDLQVREEN
jgi:hypothetical protein